MSFEWMDEAVDCKDVDVDVDNLEERLDKARLPSEDAVREDLPAVLVMLGIMGFVVVFVDVESKRIRLQWKD